MKNLTKNIITLAIVAWVLISIIFVAGEPAETMTIGQVIMAKIIGCASIAIALLAGRELDRKGWLVNDNSGNDDW